MTIINFVKALPENLVYAPIYKKDALMKSGRKATGKNPLEESWERDFDNHDLELAIDKNPDLQAVGLYTGIRGKGIVILDIDKDLAVLKQKWSETLINAPRITSTKKDAAKYIFTVPEALWGEVKGHGLRKEDGGNYEILWGRRQGVIYGAYPGGHSSEEGFYELTGDLFNIPVAPAWLLAEMKAPPKPVQNKKDLDFSDRTDDEIAQIIHECLSVISHQGLGSREHWVRVGMAIHSALPSEMGLALWSFWSSQDPDFAGEWEDAGDHDTPCTTAWYSFKSGGIGLGTLIWLADREDPERHRFSAENKKIVSKAEDKQVQEIRTSTLDFGDVIKRAKNILELDNPAEMNYKLNTLALKAGYRDQSSLEKLIVDQIQYESQKGILDLADLYALDIQREYLIPDILPTPSVVLIYGAGGDGKSMSAWTMAKHIATGDPFLVRGSKVPVDKGTVLLLNGDQPLSQLKEQLEEVNLPVTSNVKIQTDWQLQRYAQFIKLMQEHTPKLVVIDSLIGCSGGRAFDENKSDFAQPLYWLTRNNGVLFPKTTILIIHHANKNGGFRGTSAIRDAVDETWKLSKPTQEQVNKVGRSSRFITIEKSRSGRMGTQMVMKMNDDLTFSIADYTPEVSNDSESPTTVQDKVLQKLRKIHPETYTINQMIHDPMVDGKDAAIRKSFQRLIKKGLIELIEDKESNKSYKAILARGEGAYLVPLEET
nr:bifunctional DNA primase/polymerase [uncultured Mediterranean phage uvMED]